MDRRSQFSQFFADFHRFLQPFQAPSLRKPESFVDNYFRCSHCKPEFAWLTNNSNPLSAPLVKQGEKNTKNAPKQAIPLACCRMGFGPPARNRKKKEKKKKKGFGLPGPSLEIGQKKPEWTPYPIFPPIFLFFLILRVVVAVFFFF